MTACPAPCHGSGALKTAAYVLPAILLVWAQPRARADTGAVSLTENFAPPELAAIAALTVTATSLFVLNDHLTAYMGDPWFGEPGPLDLAVTEALYRGENAGPWLGGWPDTMGDTIAPGLAVAYYVTNGMTAAIRGRGATGNQNAVHELMAFAEAFSATTTLTFATKLLVGRERPLYALDRNPGADLAPDAFQSFFSGHTSTSFCIAAFASRDLGDWLLAGPLEGSSRAARVLLGRVTPGLVFYGAAAVVGLSRIIDQKHYLSDVLVGASVGAALGNGVYALHFDGRGNPRHRQPVALSFGLGPGHAWLQGRF